MNEKTYKYLWLCILILSVGMGLHLFFQTPVKEHSPVKIIDSYKSVPVYYNNLDRTDDNRETFSSDGYYYGLRWQCVEYVKRFYYVAKQHRMPNVFGDAKDFFENRKNSRQVFALTVKNQHYFIGTSSKPVGWLRKK